MHLLRQEVWHLTNIILLQYHFRLSVFMKTS